MNEYISKDRARSAIRIVWNESEGEAGLLDYQAAIESEPPADVKPVVRGENIATEYADCDQFICSRCGIHLQDWNLIEDDYEDGIVHEFVFNFCPNCGAWIRERSEEECTQIIVSK